MKTSKIVREIMILPLGIILFPIYTIRAFFWNWLFWLENQKEKIDEYHQEMDNLN